MSDSTIEIRVALSDTRPRMTGWQQASLSLYWFATQAHWSAILMTLLPLQAKHIGGDAHKGATLSTIMTLGALTSMIVAPLFGAWSDRVRTRWGRRKPFLVIGTLGNILGLTALAFIPSTPAALVFLIIGIMWVQLFNNLATAPYSALIPDVVQKAQRGSASGWMGLMSMLGVGFGALTGFIVRDDVARVPWIYGGLAVLMALGMVGSVLTVREPEPPVVAPFHWPAFARGLFEPFRSRDFLWVFLTRMLVGLGTFTVQIFVLFYMRDVVAGGMETHSFQWLGHTLTNSATGATSIFLLVLLIGAVTSSLIAGTLSDRYGRKRIVYLSGGLQALVCLLFVFTGRFEAILVMALIFGFGYGAYQAVDWALAGDVLPSKEDHAKDMGVWHVASTFPQVTAPLIAGKLLDYFQQVGGLHNIPNLGYTVIFSVAVAYFVLGTLLVRNVRSAR